MEFDDHFTTLLQYNKEFPENRILRLDYPIPSKYESSMNEFLEKFFINDPFDIKPEDLEVLLIWSGKIKKLKFNRKPSTFLSILRFLELYRQLLKSVNNDLNALAISYRKLLAYDSPDPKIANLKSQILANVFSAGRLLKKWNPQVEQFYKITITSINLSFTESEGGSANGKKFVNLRKIHSDGYLKLTFQPYYGNMINFCIMFIAYSSKMRTITADFNKQIKDVRG